MEQGHSLICSSRPSPPHRDAPTQGLSPFLFHQARCSFSGGSDLYLPLVWKPALGQAVGLGELYTWAGEGSARLTPVKGPDPKNSLLPSRRSFSSDFPPSPPSSAFPALSLFLLPPSAPLPFSPSSRLSPPPPFLVQAFLSGAQRLLGRRGASSGKAVWVSRGSRTRLGGRPPEGPPSGPAGPSRTVPAGEEGSRALAGGSAGREPQRAGSGTDAAQWAPLSRSE